MSSASGPVATTSESTYLHDASSDAFASSAGANTQKRKYDERDPQSQIELGEPFAVEVLIKSLHIVLSANSPNRLIPMGSL